MNFDFDSEAESFRQEIRDFFAKNLPDDWLGISHGDDSVTISNSVTQEMAAKGWLTQLWPKEYGGLSASVWRQAVLQQEAYAYNEPRGGQYMGVNWIGPALMRFGTEEQKQTLLPEIAEGRVQWAQLYSEPDAGSDLAAISTRAELEGDSFILNGEKIWTSFATIAQRGFLLARTGPDLRGRQGLSVLLIDMTTPGIQVSPIETPIGMHKLNSVVMRDAVVPATALLGGLNDGWNVAMTAVGFERTGQARHSRTTRILGMLERYPGVRERHPERLARLLALGRAVELMNYSVIAMREAGVDPTWEGSAARVCSTRFEMAVARFAIDALGPLALLTQDDPHSIEKGEVEAFVRLAPTAGVAAGTTEIQMAIVAERGLSMPRSR